MLAILAMTAVAATPYTLDPAQGALYVKVTKDPTTVASGLAHDHAIAASGWSGKATWGEGVCSVDVDVPVRSLVVDEPKWRELAGLDGTLADWERNQIRSSMLGAGQLDADRYPDVTFRADRCVPTGDTVSVEGELTLRGVTRTLAVPMTVTTDGGRLHATGRFTIRATDFGFAPYSAMLGAVRNRDEMEVVVDVVGVAAAPS